MKSKRKLGGFRVSLEFLEKYIAAEFHFEKHRRLRKGDWVRMAKSESP